MSARTMAITGTTLHADPRCASQAWPAGAPQRSRSASRCRCRGLIPAVALATAGGAFAQTPTYDPTAPLQTPLRTQAARAGEPATTARAPGQPPFRFELGVEETFTSNANFDRSSSERVADFVTLLAPAVRIDSETAHTSVVGTAAMLTYVYARSGSDNNRAIPQVNLVGQAHALDRHLVLDATLDAHREFASPLGARPSGASVNTDNEYVAANYLVSPAYRGELPGDVRYELRDKNLWTNVSRAPGSLGSAYTNEVIGTLAKEPRPLGWGFDYDRTTVSFDSGQDITTELARLRGEYAPDPQFRISPAVGYESNRFTLSHASGTIYGIGGRWRPGERTSVDASWEHRFFGSSYSVAADHRTPLTVWSLRASRNLSTSAQQLLNFGGGQDLSVLLNSLFSSRFPDPVQRQQAIDQLVQLYGLPTTLAGPVNLYTQQVSIVTDARASVGFLGARNSVFVAVYRTRDQAIVTATGNEPFTFKEVSQTGASLVWASRLDPTVTLTGILDFTHATGDSLSASITDQRTNNGTGSLTLSTPVSNATDFHVGTRYQFVRSNVVLDRQEAAVFAGIVHRFR